MLLAVATLAVGFSGFLQTEGRQGRPLPDAAAVSEVQAEASVQAEARAGGATATLAYEPRLLLVQGRSFDALHRGRLLFTVPAQRSLSFTLEESVTWGRQDLSPLASSTPTGSLASPTVRFVDVGSTLTTLRVSDQLSRRLRWTAAASYLFGGGRHAEDRGIYPQTRQPGLTLETLWDASRQDVLSATAEARTQVADNGSASALANLRAGLSHAFSSATTLAASTGLGWTWSRLSQDAQPVSGVLPSFDASLRSGASLRGQRLAAGLRLALAPTLDVFTGAAYTRADVGGDLAWTLPREVLVSARAELSQVVSGVLSGSRVLRGEASVGVPLRRELQLAATFRAADLRPQGQAWLAAGLQWTALVLLRWELGARG